MASTSETGHAKNVSNFLVLTNSCTGYGPDYRPSEPSLKLTALTAQQTACAAAHSAVKDPLSDYGQAVGERETIYDTVYPLTTRVNNMFQLTSAPANVKKTAKTWADKIRGINRKRKTPPLPGEAPEDDGYSTSQRSFVMMADNFDTFITIVGGEATYDPAEEDLKIEYLKSLLSDMQRSNNDTDLAFQALRTVRTERNRLLYVEGTGLVDIALAVKKYAKGAFGAQSTKYKEISGLKFTRMKKSKTPKD